MSRKARPNEILLRVSLPLHIYQQLEKEAEKERRKYPSWQIEHLIIERYANSEPPCEPDNAPARYTSRIK